MIKGKTTIELTDVNSGKTKKHEHENMITNAVKDMCDNAGLFKSPITAPAVNVKSTIAENLFGGLMLWENPLDLSSADDYYLPADNVCVGYGSGISNGTINDKMGTLNESESGKTENGYRFVWDFATNQGNGQISAVSLVPRLAGQMGLGLYPDNYNSDLNIESSNFRCDYTTEYYKCCPFLFAKDNILYGVKTYNLYYTSGHSSDHISRNGKKLIIKRIHFPTTKLYLTDKATSFMNAYSDIEIQLPDSFNISTTANAFYGFCNYDNGFIYLCIGTSNSGTNMNVQVCKISIEDWSCSIIDINATFDSKFTWFGEFGNNSGPECVGTQTLKKAHVRNNRLFIANSPAYFIDFTAPNVAQKMKYFDDTDANISNLYAPAGKYSYCTNTNNVVCMLNTETGKVSILNSVTNNCKFITQHDSIYSEGHVYHFPCLDKNVMLGIKYSYNSTILMFAVCIPHVMTTKNNLDTPVTKTNGQTMKVTYVLTEV